MENLKEQHCAPTGDDVAPFTREAAVVLANEIPQWTLSEDAKMLSRDWEFVDFTEAFSFLTKVAKIAEAEEHHPTMHNSWNKVTLELSTHDIGGLSQNDFILAAKIDTL